MWHLPPEQHAQQLASSPQRFLLHHSNTCTHRRPQQHAASDRPPEAHPSPHVAPTEAHFLQTHKSAAENAQPPHTYTQGGATGRHTPPRPGRVSTPASIPSHRPYLCRRESRRRSFKHKHAPVHTPAHMRTRAPFPGRLPRCPDAVACTLVSVLRASTPQGASCAPGRLPRRCRLGIFQLGKC